MNAVIPASVNKWLERGWEGAIRLSPFNVSDDFRFIANAGSRRVPAWRAYGVPAFSADVAAKVESLQEAC